MTPRLRRTCPGSCRPRRMRRSERTPLSAAVSPTRSVKEPQSAWIFIEAGGGVFFAFRVTSLCLGLLASSTCSIPAQEVTVLSSRALFSWYSVAKVILAFVWCMPYDVGMPKRGGSVHVATIRTKGAGDRVYTSYLLRRSYREGGHVSVRQRARNLEAVLRRDQDLARQHPADRLDGRFGSVSYTHLTLPTIYSV